MFKKLKLSKSRLLFLLIGILLAISVSGVWAAWNSTVSGGQTLTSILWNDVVAKLINLDGRVGTLESGGGAVTTNTCHWVIGTNICSGGTTIDVICPTNEILSGVRYYPGSGACGRLNNQIDIYCCTASS